jgi:hypothetical protein
MTLCYTVDKIEHRDTEGETEMEATATPWQVTVREKFNLDDKQAWILFQLTEQLASSRRCQGNEYLAELAFMAADATGWKSLKAARCMAAVMGYYRA